MANRLAGGVAVVTAVAGTTLAPLPMAVGSAPAAIGVSAPAPERGAKSTWTEADKSGFGTARPRGSNVWFTLQRGRVSEVFYPDLSTPSVRALELVVVGKDFVDAPSSYVADVVRPDAQSLRYEISGSGHPRRYLLTQEVITDPADDSVVVRVHLDSLDGGAYRLFAVHDPALANDGMDDTAGTARKALTATDGTVATHLVSRPAFSRTANGLAGTASDPRRALRRTGGLGRTPTAAGPGNVVQVGRVAGRADTDRPLVATVTLGLGATPRRAAEAATGSRHRDWDHLRDRYDAGWHRYLSSLKDVPASATGLRAQYLASALVLAAAEDKQHPGAIIASPSAPWVWGDEVEDLSSPSGAYHLVWSRDLYQFATALWAMGDRAAARRTVEWLFGTQQQRDGSFPQNSDVAGEPVWDSLQLDEVALPIVLAHLTGKRDAATWRGVRRAADFLVTFRDEESGRRAPYSTQERWENQSGYSPNSIATQIAALVCAADLARARGERDLAHRWLRFADRWERTVKARTVTRNGPLSERPYFLRLTKDGRPDRGTTYEMGDGGPRRIDQRRVVDPSFLELVRLGILPADDRVVTSSLDVVDEQLRVDTPNGPFWHRFTRDGYGETRKGGEWVITDPGAHRTLGRGWPILTGERGEYAVAAGEDAAPYLDAMAAAAGESDMISEQVWDGRRPTGRDCCPAGEGTRAATPLVWSHAELVRLAWTIQTGAPVDQPRVVAQRYLR
ncbi:glycoside hydrolase family 15 protein [Nocardioides sp. YIM 152315]|uniref:glycoside hydrolase family 15 protein n=1 Tax=Nocardioides sp. YIM 152315 TaxID=3031760 RepID=UPI0023DCD4B7|nr:glycoside hydrolase family 15 protein [Nocardioides sp. YIM 152315]MDF1605648.1 glycoside hydrolase family 15 protein [Nocardioides sp. YIM 152315]